MRMRRSSNSLNVSFICGSSLNQRFVLAVLFLMATSSSLTTAQQAAGPQRAPMISRTPAAKRTPAAAGPQQAAGAAVRGAGAAVRGTGAAATAQQQAPADPFQLTPAEQKRLIQILGFWEHRSSKVKTYTCKFERWEYDAVFGPKDPRFAKTKSVGTIRYAEPDKGEFRVTAMGDYKPQKNKPGGYPMQESDHEEHWICDGNSVFELNGKLKQLREEKLPPEMRGQRIADGPLPFMFGAEKEKLLARYWMKEIVPPYERKGEYWIDARPKFRSDAVNFQRVLVILDEQEFLPVAMQVFPPNYDQKRNWTRTTYTFSDRRVNLPIHRGQQFLGGFIAPRVPLGWKKVAANAGQPAAAAPRPPAGRNPAAGQANRPSATQPRR